MVGQFGINALAGGRKPGRGLAEEIRNWALKIRDEVVTERWGEGFGWLRDRGGPDAVLTFAGPPFRASTPGMRLVRVGRRNHR